MLEATRFKVVPVIASAGTHHHGSVHANARVEATAKSRQEQKGKPNRFPGKDPKHPD
jgi:hypothetical protein